MSLFLCAVMLSAWLGGVWPGLLAAAFSYYFVSPIFSLAVDSKEIPRFVMFVLAAVLVGSLGVAQRRRDAVAPEGGGGAARDVGSARARHPGHDDGGAGGLHRP